MFLVADRAVEESTAFRLAALSALRQAALVSSVRRRRRILQRRMLYPMASFLIGPDTMKIYDRKCQRGQPCIDDDPDATELDASIIDGYTAGRLLARCSGRDERQAAAAEIAEAVAKHGLRRRKQPDSGRQAC